MHTTVVTALSGVAAASIGSETLHSAAALNRNIDEEKDASWVNARLIIIDECSLMDVALVGKLDSKLCMLTQRQTAIYGGLHVLFGGDFRQLGLLQVHSFTPVNSLTRIGSIQSTAT